MSLRAQRHKEKGPKHHRGSLSDYEEILGNCTWLCLDKKIVTVFFQLLLVLRLRQYVLQNTCFQLAIICFDLGTLCDVNV